MLCNPTPPCLGPPQGNQLSSTSSAVRAAEGESPDSFSKLEYDSL